MEIEVALNSLQVDDAEGADIGRIIDFIFFHDFAGALNDAADSGLADKHVMRFFGEHEAAGAGERVEAGFSEGAELEFAVAVGEESKHVEGEPIGRGLVENAGEAWVVSGARTAGGAGCGVFAAVAPQSAGRQ